MEGGSDSDKLKMVLHILKVGLLAENLVAAANKLGDYINVPNSNVSKLDNIAIVVEAFKKFADDNGLKY